jgi:putative flippase GtrA
MAVGISFAYWVACLWVYRDRTRKGPFWPKLENGIFTFVLVVGHGYVFSWLGWCLGHPSRIMPEFHGSQADRPA